MAECTEVLELASLQAMVITNRIRTSIGALKTLEAWLLMSFAVRWVVL